MHLILAEALAIIPALAILSYYYRQDKRKPEPKGLVTRIFLLGIIVTLPVIVAELLIGHLEGFLGQIPLAVHFFRAFVVAAFCEEWFKLLIIKRFAYRDMHFDEIMDGIVYATVASLGFACLENILYVLDGGIQVAVLRAFSAVPMHALASGMMGYYVGQAKFAPDQRQERVFFRKGLWAAICIHGIYDFIIFASPDVYPLLGFSIFPLLIVVFFMLRRKIKLAIAEDIRAGHGIIAPPPLPDDEDMSYGERET